MPKRGLAALAITTVALVLLINFKTPDEPLPSRSSGNVAVVEPVAGQSARPRATAAPGSTAAPRATRAPAGATPAPTTATGGGAAGATTVDGQVVSTRFGPVQVEVVVAGGQIKEIVALQLPTGRRSGQISNYSAPILREEALQAQSANIDIVSGATYTSDAYSRSLQSALDQAGVG